VLRFSPYAWSKLLYLRDVGDTEIGGFGVAALTDGRLLTIEDFVLVKQTTTAVTVKFDDTAVADYFEQQVELGRKPEQFARVWLHTHPANSATPSSTDEETFSRVFGTCDWAVMFILAKGGQTYCRLRFNTGPGVDVAIPVEVDYSLPFAGSDQESWQAEYDACVTPEQLHVFTGQAGKCFDDIDGRQSSRLRRRHFADGDDEDLQAMLMSEYAQYYGLSDEELQSLL